MGSLVHWEYLYFDKLKYQPVGALFVFIKIYLVVDFCYTCMYIQVEGMWDLYENGLDKEMEKITIK